MTDMQADDERVEWLGEEWIQALVDKDFQHLAAICQPDVHSRLMTPRRIDTLENAADLTQKVAGWFQDCSAFQKEQTRIAMVGKKLAIFYRLTFDDHGQPREAEQQLYCTLRDGLIDQLSLLCSGFQPVQGPVETPITQPVNSAQPSLYSDAFLKFDTGGGQGSTCAILTPSIKRKLGEMSSGQVLEVQVDDPSAKEDVEAWCRLSGNSLLKMDTNGNQQLHFYLMKK